MTDFRIPLDLTPEVLGYPAEVAEPAHDRVPALSRQAVAALVVVVLAVGTLTYALVHTTQDLHRTRGTLAATRSTLGTTQTELGQARTDLASTRKDLSTTKATLADTKSELDDVKSQLDAAKADATQQRSRGDAAVRAALDVRECLDNIASNSNALMAGDYARVTWNDSMKAECDQALQETSDLTGTDDGSDVGTDGGATV